MKLNFEINSKYNENEIVIFESNKNKYLVGIINSVNPINTTNKDKFNIVEIVYDIYYFEDSTDTIPIVAHIFEEYILERVECGSLKLLLNYIKTHNIKEAKPNDKR